MLSSRPLGALLLLCVTSASLSRGALALDTSQSAPTVSGKVVVVSGGYPNENSVDGIHGSPEESVGDVNSTKEKGGMGADGSNPAESDRVSEGDEGSASEQEEYPVSQDQASEAPEGEAGQASEKKADRELQREMGPVPPAGDEGDEMLPDGENTADTEQNSVPAATPASENYGLSFDEDERTGKILAYYTTKVKNLFATTTVSRLSTCFSATNTPQCMGRRKKRHLDRNMDAAIFDLEGSESLHGTVADPVDPSYESGTPARGDRDPKKFTVWSTMFSTFTLTSTYYYPGTTVTVSGVCVLPGLGSGCFG